MTRNYCCLECGNLICCTTALHGNGICRLCYFGKIKNEGNPNYRNGNTLEIYKCNNCKKEIGYQVKSGLCRDCYNNDIHSKIITKNYCCMECGNLIHHHTALYSDGLCRSCNRKSISKGENNPNYKDGRTLKQHYCVDCNKQIDYRNIRCGSCNNILKFKGKTYKEIMGYKKAEELKTIRSLSQGGTGVPYENSGYGKEFTKSLKEIIRKRDNYTCQCCGKLEIENKINLHIHHIDYNKINCNEYNLISLCSSCHGKTNINREKWIEFFNSTIHKDKFYGLNNSSSLALSNI